MLMEINYGGDTRAYEHARPPMDITLLMRVLVCVCVCVCVGPWIWTLHAMTF